jgi:single-stranded DNA-binding protein
MADQNVVTVEGNLTKAPVLIEKEGRKPVSLLRIACNRSRLNPTTEAWENHPRFFDVKVYGPKAIEVSSYAKGEKVRINEGYLDWYEKGKGAERREYVSIVAAGTSDGITRVPKAAAQSEAGKQSQAPEQAQASEQPKASSKSKVSSTKSKPNS